MRRGPVAQGGRVGRATLAGGESCYRFAMNSRLVLALCLAAAGCASPPPVAHAPPGSPPLLVEKNAKVAKALEGPTPAPRTIALQALEARAAREAPRVAALA